MATATYEEPRVVIEGTAYKMTTLGLIIKGKIAFEHWELLGAHLGDLQKGIQWALGDWLIYGESQPGWSSTYAQALDKTHFDYGTLRNFKWVAVRIPMGERRLELSWSHHYYVASCDKVERDSLLDKCETEGWSTRDLRIAMAGRKAPNRYAEVPPLKSDTMAPAEPGLSRKKSYTMADLKVIYLDLPQDQQEAFRKWVNSF